MFKLLTILSCLMIWALIAYLQIMPSFILPSPLAVFGTLWREHLLLLDHAGTTLLEIIIGAALGTGLGMVCATIMWVYPKLDRMIGPFLKASQVIPVFVLAPILTLWLGYGLAPKIVMVVLLVFFPVSSSLLHGLSATPDPLLDLARINQASRWRELRWLRLPHALPFLGSGLRIGLLYAPAGAVIGEWIGASRGLGYLMLMANARSRTDLMFAAMLILIAIAGALTLSANAFLRRQDM